MKSLLLVLLLALAPGQLLAKGPFDEGLKLVKKNDFAGAARFFYKIAYGSTTSASDRPVARYYLGLSLSRLGLKQAAVFPLVLAARDQRPDVKKRALDVLVGISRTLRNRQLLNFTLERVSIQDVSEVSKKAFHLMAADKELGQGHLEKALSEADQALADGKTDFEAVYLRSLIALKMDKPGEAASGFNLMFDQTKDKSPGDSMRGLATVSVARALYQERKFSEAAEYYNKVAKDNPLYRQSQLELAWSYFMSTRFRSALKTLQTVQNSFYENFWDPETLILRSMIFLFTCQHEEAQKALRDFDRIYVSSYNTLSEMMNQKMDPGFYWGEVAKARAYLEKAKRGRESAWDGKIPFFILRTLFEDPSIRDQLIYHDQVQNEQKTLEAKKKDLGPLGGMVQRALEIRTKKIRADIGRLMRLKIQEKMVEIIQLNTQAQFINYEILNSMRRNLTKKIANSGADKNKERLNRSILIENGYRYWPFSNETWRDEIGNYQYFGESRCE